MRKSAKPPRAAPERAERLVFERDGRAVWQGDCLAWLAVGRPGRFSACVTDPPYELGFMGRKWDKSGVSFDPETWRAVLRALRPGAHLVAFGGARTFHRIACAIEDGGFEIRDTLMWVYGQGFSKSLDVSKAIDKAKGAERKKVRVSKNIVRNPKSIKGGHNIAGGDRPWMKKACEVGYHDIDGDEPATPEAACWQGWGTGLKPAWEPIILARKPLDGAVAECVLRHGTGVLNVDGCRIGTESMKVTKSDGTIISQNRCMAAPNTGRVSCGETGRWPPNAVFQHDARCVRVGEQKIASNERPNNVGKRYPGAKVIPRGDLEYRTYGRADASGRETVDLWACVPGCPVRMLDEQSGQTGPSFRRGDRTTKNKTRMFPMRTRAEGMSSASGGFGDSGGASRFFYCPKANTAERRAGLSMLEDNAHPTVKPVALMEWLLRLVAPPGGEVLDPFAGSGSTLVAAKRLGIAAVGIDLDAEACETAAARLTRRTAKGLGGTKKLRLKRRRKHR